jgi:hypothetical protein
MVIDIFSPADRRGKKQHQKAYKKLHIKYLNGYFIFQAVFELLLFFGTAITRTPLEK